MMEWNTRNPMGNQPLTPFCCQSQPHCPFDRCPRSSGTGAGSGLCREDGRWRRLHWSPEQSSARPLRWRGAVHPSRPACLTLRHQSGLEVLMHTVAWIRWPCAAAATPPRLPSAPRCVPAMYSSSSTSIPSPHPQKACSPRWLSPTRTALADFFPGPAWSPPVRMWLPRPASMPVKPRMANRSVTGWCPRPSSSHATMASAFSDCAMVPHWACFIRS